MHNDVHKNDVHKNDGDKNDEAAFALFVNCQTSLVEEWKDRFEHYCYGGNRSVHFRCAEDLKRPELRIMIAEALTYHRRKRKPRGVRSRAP